MRSVRGDNREREARINIAEAATATALTYISETFAGYMFSVTNVRLEGVSGDEATSIHALLPLEALTEAEHELVCKQGAEYQGLGETRDLGSLTIPTTKRAALFRVYRILEDPATGLYTDECTSGRVMRALECAKLPTYYAQQAVAILETLDFSRGAHAAQLSNEVMSRAEIEGFLVKATVKRRAAEVT